MWTPISKWLLMSKTGVQLKLDAGLHMNFDKETGVHINADSGF